uniref:Uncharacterized protein n=1 Tax=Solanum lycopersicum TaxID=4081 RepID=A0A3Q7F5N1_SOLLC
MKRGCLHFKSRSPASAWEDSLPEKSEGHSQFFWDEYDDQGELSQFICQFYESRYQIGSRIDDALQHARRYSCHLPSIP